MKKPFFWKSDLEYGSVVFLTGEHCSIVFRFPSGFRDCLGYGGVSNFWLSRDLCRVFGMKDLISGVLDGFKNRRCIAECSLNM